MYEGLLYVLFCITPAGYKGILQRSVPAVMMLQQVQKIEQVGSIECAMGEAEELLQVGIVVMEDELMRVVIHPPHELLAIVDYGGAVAPCEHCCKKACNLDILLFGEGVRNGYGVFFYKRRAVIERNFSIEKLFELPEIIHCIKVAQTVKTPRLR